MKVKPMVAELIGTFLFVFAGVVSLIAMGLEGAAQGHIAPSMAHGIAIAILVSATMHISGGQLNPAVTVGVWLGNQISFGQAIANICAQIAGGIAAVFALKRIFPNALTAGVDWGTPSINANLNWEAAISLEAIFTFILVLVVFGTAVDKRAPRVGGLYIGLAILLAGLAIGPATGACLNPARFIGPALINASWQNWMVYIGGPVLGGALAGLIYTYGIGREDQLDEPGEV